MFSILLSSINFPTVVVTASNGRFQKHPPTLFKEINPSISQSCPLFFISISDELLSRSHLPCHSFRTQQFWRRRVADMKRRPAPPRSNHQNLTPKTKTIFVSIPVHFVESAAESTRKHSVAVRIQKLIRRFLVRKKVWVVRRIEVEVEEIERRIERDLDLPLREERERIRINEMLMALLLRLDSVRGVRDYRRKVIRQAISMQETVDTLSSSLAMKSEEDGGEDAATEYQEALGNEEAPGNEEEAAIEVQETLETLRNRGIPEGTLANHESEVHEEAALEFHETIQTIRGQETLEETLVNSDKTGSGVPEILENTRDEGIKNQATSQEEIKAGFFMVDPMKSEERTGEDQEIPVKEIGVVDEVVFPMEEDGWSIIEAPEYDESGAEPSKPPSKTGKSGLKPSEELRLKEMMERMLAENEKLKGLVVELCERSTMQCKLTGGLAKRIEQLEKTMQVMEKRKMKKRETNSI